ncbi:MAG: DUF1543 domain-containing protein [Pseudobdellovibrionaceae bacterium]|nr:DUF1543 domain-containing protein [Bdellovibrionales bacterium]USN46096.1 MAG: DUF1543 domain-containing protein [Pseudobdellovibrionaceae bacterium]
MAYMNHMLIFFVAAESFAEARSKIKTHEEFKAKRMHVDGLQEIQAIDGFRVALQQDHAFEGKSKIINFKYRDLAPVSGKKI